MIASKLVYSILSERTKVTKFSTTCVLTSEVSDLSQVQQKLSHQRSIAPIISNRGIVMRDRSVMDSTLKRSSVYHSYLPERTGMGTTL
ncbi:hypothetical protein CSKR_107096 [Clonorchis sinensis]|uniref:Uncharacterized protein n=1 Tax=Clonorchis sinensis TaxID=79923 RepID=A0A8T1MK55_CLOSI|nr:hypothetical protein CSKR_107096 [Clonorchis sinensis]